MDLTIVHNKTSKTVANIPAGETFCLPEYEDRVYQVLYHSMSDTSICLCFRPGRPPERAELSGTLGCRPVRFTAASFEHC
jgi:hypothetical protein